MKKLSLAVIVASFVLTSCQTEEVVQPPIELPFATHPSVLRGSWSGTIFNIPESKNSTLELTDLTAECADYPESDIAEDRCYNYTFSGDIRIEGSPPVSIRGEGTAGNYLYTLLSPTDPITPSVYARFELNGESWSFLADYRSSDFQDLEDEPAFEGYLSSDNVIGQGSSFRLEPTTP